MSFRKGLGTPFLMMKPLRSNPCRKETRLGEPAALQHKQCLGTGTQNVPKEIKYPVKVRNINARGGYPHVGSKQPVQPGGLGRNACSVCMATPHCYTRRKMWQPAFMTRG